MKKRFTHMLMLLLLCMLGWHTSAIAAVEPHIQYEGSSLSYIDHTDDSPQWEDVGMCDILAITGGSTLIPPSTVRVVHDSPSGIAPTIQSVGARHYIIQRLSAYSHCRMVSGYIYLIRCLRL